MASRELKVEIIGDASSLNKALGSVSKTSSKLGTSMKTLGKVAAGAGLLVGAGFVATLKVGFEELAESQKVMAQTEAVIKSTGGAANVTAKQMTDYAGSLSEVSGVDDEVIQSGENMLATFTNIRNETGKGNDVFRQATGTLLDMSTALGTDMNKSAIQLGKALNDSIKGVSALARVGVTFTEGQKKTIASLVESGDKMGAQKLILKELNKEFGGSAAAFGETMPGQLAKLRNAFDEVAANLAAKFLPILTTLGAWVNDNWGSISAVFDAVGTAIITSFNAIGTAVNWLRTQWEIHRESAIAAWKAVQSAVMTFISWFNTNVVPPIKTAIAAAIAIWNNFGGEIKAIGNAIVTFVKTWIQNMVAPIRIALALLRGDWSEAWNELKATVSRTLGAALSIIKGMIGAFVSAAVAIGMGIIRGIVGALAGLAGKVAEKFGSLYATLRGAAVYVGALAFQIGAAIIQGIGAGFMSLVNSIKDTILNAIFGVVNAIRSAMRIGSPSRLMADEVGKPMAEGIGAGFMERIGPVGDRASDATRDVVRKMSQAIKDAKAEYTEAFGDLAQSGIDAIAAKYKDWKPPSLIKAQREAEEREKARFKQSMADARTALEEAMLGGDPAQIASAQAALDDLLFQQRQAALTKKAEQEQKAHDESVKKEQAAFAKRAQAILDAGGNVTAKLIQLFKDYDLAFLKAGNRWGVALADGLRAALDDVKKAADELADAVKDRTKPGSPAKKGPLSTFDMFDAGRQFGMDWSAGMRSASKSAGRAAGSVAGRAAGAFGRGAAGSARGGGGGGGGKKQKFDDSAGGGGPMPKWAYPPIWETAVSIATSIGKLKEFGEAIRMGSYKSNAGLLNGIFQNRSKRNWGLVSYPIVQQMMEMMKKPDGMSGKEVADYFGLLAKGGIVKKDGYAYLHANEAVVPLPKGGGRMGQATTVIFNGPVLGTEEQLTRKIIEGIRREQSRGAPTITRGR